MAYPSILKNLLEELQKLPGIGAKTAERLMFHILKAPDKDVFALSMAIREVKEKVKKCKYCFNITEEDPCMICSNPKRDQSILCIVEQPKDLLAIEKTGQYQGLYHVLMGKLAPLENEHPEHLTIDSLLKRIQKSLESTTPIKEIILATNPNLEGDTTALYLLNCLKEYPILVSRIARGISSGSSIEFANEAILSDALNDRKTLQNTNKEKTTTK
ncbi:MAG: recombination protein RecR [Candidatus Brocadiae bacterium]|nr:recombination protein RecR [Candidatus Brocadiia bacterium]